MLRFFIFVATHKPNTFLFCSLANNKFEIEKCGSQSFQPLDNEDNEVGGYVQDLEGIVFWNLVQRIYVYSSDLECDLRVSGSKSFNSHLDELLTIAIEMKSRRILDCCTGDCCEIESRGMLGLVRMAW